MKKISLEQIPNMLPTVSVILWVLSLLATAIVYDDEVLPGFFVLIAVFLFGWMSFTFQAYTNVFYLIALYKALDGKPSPKLATIAFVGGLSSFFLTELQTTNESSTTYAHIDAWGWGAILWISAYALILLHTLYLLNADKHFATVIKGVILIPVLWVIVFAIGKYQYHHANEEEKARVFETISMRDAIELISNGSKMSVFIPFMAIKPAIARPLSGLPYSPLDKNILSKDSIIEFKGTLTDYYDYEGQLDGFEIYLPQRFIYDNKFISRYGGISIIIDVQKLPDYILTAHKESDIFTVKIYDENNQSTIWQAPIRVKKRKYGNSYYPNYKFSNFFDALDNGRLPIKIGKTITLSSIAIQEEQKTTDNTLYQLQFPDELSNEQKIW